MPRRFRKYARKQGKVLRRARRGYRVLRGRGDYKDFFRKIGNGIKKGASWLWNNGGKDLLVKGGKTLLGVGDYRSTLSGKSLRYMSMVPGMHKARMGGVRITHREQIRLPDVTFPAGNFETGGALAATRRWSLANGLTYGFFLNPGNPGVFPWLNKIANQFEQYKFLGLAFEYRAISGESLASTKPAVGLVCFSTEYDVYRPQPTGLYNQTALQYVNTGKPSQNFLHGIECARKSLIIDRYNVRNATRIEPADPAQGDGRLAWLGYTCLSTSGCNTDDTLAQAYMLGYVWVTYDVVLYQPTIQPLAASGSGAGPQSDLDIQMSVGDLGPFVAPAPMGTYAVARPLGSWTQYQPPVLTINNVGVQPVYDAMLLPGNQVNPNGIDPGYVNGFAFANQGDQGAYYQVTLTYTGTGPCTTGFAIGDFVGLGGAKFVGLYPGGSFFTGDMGNATASTCAVTFVLFMGAIGQFAVPAGFAINGGHTIDLPAAGAVSNVEYEIHQIPSGYPGLAAAPLASVAWF